MKLCRDCKYYERFGGLCKHPESFIRVDPNTGFCKYHSAKAFRAGKCGNVGAIYFKLPLYKKLFNKIFKRG